MSLVRITKPSDMYLIDSVGLDFIAYLMDEFAKKYDCSNLVYNVYRWSSGMVPSLVAKFDSSSRCHFAMGDYSYPYTYLEKFADDAIKPYYQDGRFPGHSPVIYHDGEISYGMALGAKDCQLVVGLTVSGSDHHGFLACGCLAKLLLFTIDATNRKRRKSIAPEKDQEAHNRLKTSVSEIWEYIIQTQGLVAVEASGFISDMMRGDAFTDFSIRCMLDCLQSK
ncbi:MAG: hypothetical protein ACK5MU_02340 [Candidatus Saccharimonadales bacterium]